MPSTPAMTFAWLIAARSVQVPSPTSQMPSMELTSSLSCTEFTTKAGTCTAVAGAPNSEVLPDASVAVARTSWPSATLTTPRLAIWVPCARSLYESLPRNTCPSFPAASAVKNSAVIGKSELAGSDVMLYSTIRLPTASIRASEMSGKFCRLLGPTATSSSSSMSFSVTSSCRSSRPFRLMPRPALS